MKATRQALIGRTITDVDFRPFAAGDGGENSRNMGKAHNPRITLDNGRAMYFVTEETEVGEYGTQVCITKPVKPEPKTKRAARGRVDILVWREHGDDDDSLAVDVFAAGDQKTITAIVAKEHGVKFGDGTPDGRGKGYKSDDYRLADGMVLTSHNGRKFRVSITEVTE